MSNIYKISCEFYVTGHTIEEIQTKIEFEEISLKDNIKINKANKEELTLLKQGLLTVINEEEIEEEDNEI